MNELPKISSKDFIGKDLCRHCHKEVKIKQQAILCDSCERWTHRTCSDMNVQLYNKQKRRNYFQWNCNKCRIDEKVINDKVDTTKLKEVDIPDTYDAIQKSNKELLILHMNCRSINNKQEEVETIIQNLNPDILCLTETWMDGSMPLQSNTPDGYSMIRKDRTEGFKQKYGRNKGGGVAIMYKNHIKVEKKSYLTDKIEEILWVQVKTKTSFMLGVIYRADYTELLNDDDGESKIEENIRKACEISDSLIITGDFNIDMLDPLHKNAQRLSNIYTTYGLTQQINKATRIDKNTFKPTVIDHIWANKESKIIKSCGTFIGLSDHLGIYMKLNRSKPPQPKTTVHFRNYKNYNVESFCTQLKRNLDASSIQEHLDRSDINAATEDLISIIQNTTELHAPMKQIKVSSERKNIPWFSTDLKEMIMTKNELLQDYFCHGLEVYKQRIKTLSNKITSLKRTLKQNYVTEQIEKAQGDPKKYWKVMNIITNRTKSKDVIEPDMMTQDKANLCNKFFATIGIEIQKKIGIVPETVENSRMTQINMPTFKFTEVNDTDVEKLIDKIRSDVAIGDDKIGAKIIKDIKHTISPILAKIINKGYKTNTFPNCMKKAIIRAIHKKESTNDISNYRPISILSTLSKVFERSAVNQLVRYLEGNKLLCKNQHAYRQLHSTVTCLAEEMNHIYQLIDDKRLTAIVSLDLSKAFDSIDHQLILKKLYNLGLERTAVLWIESYLTNRKQITKFKNFTSKEETVSSGIPQGSILGPLLFLCFTNDLASEFTDEAKMIGYADDTQLVVDAKNLTQLKRKIERVIKIAQNWYNNNSMKNNISKTEILVLNPGSKNNHIQINVIDEGEQIVIKSQPHITVLGVIIDSKLTWANQVNSVKKKAMNLT